MLNPPTGASPPIGTGVVRAINARAALRLLLDHGPLTRPEIAASLGVSKPTASHLLSQLREMSLVKSDGNRDGAIGRAAELFSADARIAHMAALDVTPERIAAAVVDFAGAIVGEFELPTLSGKIPDPAADVHAALAGACAAAGIDLTDLRRVVIGIQGAIDPTTDRLRFAAHIPGWQRAGLSSTIEARVGVPIDIENDVNLAAIAERVSGAAEGLDSFALLWVSDGIGMGLMLGGRLHRGLTGGAGEISDMPIPGAPTVQESPEYGSNGMQALAGAPALEEVLRQHGFTGDTVTDALAAAVDSDAEGAAAALDEIARRLALGLSAVVAIIDPELLVLAGSLAAAGSDRLRSLVQHHLYAIVTARPPVLLTRVDGNPVLTGALWLAVTVTQDEVLASVSGGQKQQVAAED
ncbi:ROK family transcriptional regulator [Microbacterium sp. LWH12-1.2]|uniref:ROK family transcriptional regulator n=1 Tax=Microbacterium sp. LWH12-1.2 TaxID=3135259 RepID=UPI003445A13F